MTAQISPTSTIPPRLDDTTLQGKQILDLRAIYKQSLDPDYNFSLQPPHVYRWRLFLAGDPDLNPAYVARCKAHLAAQTTLLQMQ